MMDAEHDGRCHVRGIGAAERRLHDEQHEAGDAQQHADAVRDGVGDLLAYRVERGLLGAAGFMLFAREFGTGATALAARRAGVGGFGRRGGIFTLGHRRGVRSRHRGTSRCGTVA